MANTLPRDLCDALHTVVHRGGEERDQGHELQDREDEPGTGRGLRMRMAGSVKSVSHGERWAEKQEARTEPSERMPSAK